MILMLDGATTAKKERLFSSSVHFYYELVFVFPDLRKYLLKTNIFYSSQIVDIQIISF